MIACLCNKLVAEDINVQVPACKALGNLMVTDCTKLIDLALYNGIVDKLVKLSKNEILGKEEAVVKDICFALSNISCGT